MLSPAQEILFSELIKTLVSAHCPLITRQDSWWMEELVLKPGKPRTDLLLWIIGKLTNSLSPQDNDQTSSSSNTGQNYRLPEDNEGIHDLFCQSGILSTDPGNYLPFIEGTMEVGKQLDLWTLLVNPLQNVDKHNSSLMITTGFNTLQGIVSMDNFLNMFRLTATLLPADVRSEISQKNKQRQQNLSSSAVQTVPVVAPVLFDEAFANSITEEAQQLKRVSDEFLSVCKSHLKTDHSKKDNLGSLVDLGQSIGLIHGRISSWKKDVDSLLELHRRNTGDKSRHKVNEILERCTKDKAYEYFQELCQNEWSQ